MCMQVPVHEAMYHHDATIFGQYRVADKPEQQSQARAERQVRSLTVSRVSPPFCPHCFWNGRTLECNYTLSSQPCEVTSSRDLYFVTRGHHSKRELSWITYDIAFLTPCTLFDRFRRPGGALQSHNPSGKYIFSIKKISAPPRPNPLWASSPLTGVGGELQVRASYHSASRMAAEVSTPRMPFGRF